MTVESFKNLAEAAESVITAGGIVVAGVWTYLIFVRRRQRFPRAALSHQTHSFRLPDGRRLLRVAATIANSGEVLVCLRTITTRVQHVLPLPDHIAVQLKESPEPPSGESEFPWPVLGKRQWRIDETMGEIEPGEAEILQSDFVIPAGVEQVLVYTHVPNHAKSQSGIGWSDTVVVSLIEGRQMAHSQPKRDSDWNERQLPYRPDPPPPPITPQLPYRPDLPPPPPKKDGAD
jgi:hypothetical protein